MLWLFVKEIDFDFLMQKSCWKLGIDNPDLSYEFVRETLLATEEVNQGLAKRYVRKTKRS